jgi:hypothetical protein
MRRGSFASPERFLTTEPRGEPGANPVDASTSWIRCASVVQVAGMARCLSRTSASGRRERADRREWAAEGEPGPALLNGRVKSYISK